MSGQEAATVVERVRQVRQANEDTRQFVAEQRKLIAEQLRLNAEAAKLLRDRAWVPWQAVATLMGAGGALVAATVALMKVLGH